MSTPTLLSDAPWDKLLELLRYQPGIYIGNEAHCRRFIEAVLWTTAAERNGGCCRPTTGTGTACSSASTVGANAAFGSSFTSGSLPSQTWRIYCSTAQFYVPMLVQPEQKGATNASMRAPSRRVQQQTARAGGWTGDTLSLCPDRWRSGRYHPSGNPPRGLADAACDCRQRR